MDTTQMLYLAGAFVLGFLVAWFAGRNGPKRALEECEANAHSLQRSLDDRTRSVSKLEGQLKEQVAQVDRLGSEQGKLAATLKAAEQGAADAATQVAQLQEELNQSQSDRLRLESELGHVRGAYADTRTRLAELFAQNEAQTAAAEAEAESTALALAEASRGEQVEQLTAQVQSLQTELEAVRANATRLAGQVALRPELTTTQQKEYAALAGDPERVVAALHQRDMQVADARAEADYLRRTVGMLTGMGAELAQEVDRRRREQQVLLYQVAGLNAVTRETEMRQLVDRQAPPVQTSAGSAQAEQTPAGTIEPEGHDLPVDTRPDNALEPDSEAGESREELAALAVDLRQQLEQRSQELEELRTQTGPLQANLDELQAEIEALNAAKADLEAQLETRDNDLTELQNKLVDLQSEAESAAAAKAALAEKLQARGAAWTELVSRVTAVNADLDALLAAEPAEATEGAAEDGDATPAEPTAEVAAEVAALAATAPSEPAVPEAARAADAAAPAAESSEAAEDGSAEEDDAPDAVEPLRKLAAGVAAAAALFGRKNARLAEFEQQVQTLAGDKSALEETLATKAGVETQLAELQAQADEVTAAKSAVEQSLQGREMAWQSLLDRLSAVSADLDTLLAAEPAPEPEADAEAIAPEAAAPEAVAPAAEAEAAAPAVEGGSAEGEESEAQAAPQDASVPVLDKLAAGVAAAAALFGRKNRTLAEREQQLNALAGDKGTLESTLAVTNDELAGVQTRLAELQAQADEVTAAKAAVEQSLQGRETAWQSLLDRLSAVSADLDTLLAAEPAPEPEAAAPEAEAEAAAPAVEGSSAEGEESEEQAAAPQDASVPVLDKLAAGVAAAAALFMRKNRTLAEREQQLNALAGDKGTLESTLAAKDQSLVATQSKIEQLQAAMSQRSQRFDALSMHASSLEADMEIRKIERSRLEDQVRAVAADLQALAKSYAPAPAEGAPADESATAEPAADAAPAVTPGTLDELSAAAAAVAELLRSKENTLQAAQTELAGVQQMLAEHSDARQALAAELESRGASLTDFESRLQSLQGEYTGVQAAQGDLQNTLKTLGEQLRGYLAEYGEPVEEAAEAEVQATPDGAADATANSTEPVEPASPAAAIAAVAAVGELLKRRKDALDGANVRIGDLDAEISAMTSQKSEMDTQAEQQEQTLADLTAQLEAAQAELATHTAEAETLKQQVADVTAQLEAAQADLQTHTADAEALTQQVADVTAQLEAAQADLQAHTAEAETLKQQVADLTAQLEAAEANVTAATGEADALKQQVADVTAQLEAAQAEVAARTTDADTLKNQLEVVQAQAAATEEERVRLDAQLRMLDDNLSRFGAALAADDETEVSALAQRLGADAAPASEATRSIDVPLIKTAGAVALAGVAGKKLADLKAASAQLSALQQEHAALLAAKSDLESQLQSETASLEATKAQLADLQAELSAANAAHADEIQVLDAKTAELQSQYNEAESTRLRLESSLAALNQEIEQLGAALESDDDEGLQQFVQKLAPAEAGEAAAEPENGAAKVLGVAAVAAAVQRKQAAVKEAAFKEADTRAATIQAQLDEVIAEKEAAKTLLADRDQALQEVETKLTEVTTQAEAKVSDFKAAARAAAEERGIEVQTVRALQDFAELKHIGVTFEQRLYRAGAGTFWEVAHMTDEDFAVILRLTEMQQLAMDLNETRADAVRLAEETGTLGAISEGETPDDFEPIQGIGKVFEQRLYSAGIRTYWDLANASEEQLAEICKARKPLVPDYASWVRQARILMEVRSDDSQ